MTRTSARHSSHCGYGLIGISDSLSGTHVTPTGGNQRETDRKKAQKKLQEAQKGKVKESAASLQKRREQLRLLPFSR
ncbi:hypothetical protein BDW22DRAFT_1355563 [Trametopsis cervina]|nr:hypothetical protein BDW22DRAFT_1355563 [Trametopsis cervina]